MSGSAKDLELWAWKEHGVYISRESTRRVFLGNIDPTACGAELLLVIVGFFSLPDSKLGPIAERRLVGLRSLAGGEPPRAATASFAPRPATLPT